MSAPSLLVLGVGNPFAGDDAVGPAALALLRKDFVAPAEARLEDGGTRGLALLPLLEEVRDVILLDAVRGREPPGSLVRLEREQIAQRPEPAVSGHEMGVAALASLLRFVAHEPERFVLLGIVPERIAPFTEVSPRVSAALPDLVERTIEEAGAMGYLFRRRGPG